MLRVTRCGAAWNDGSSGTNTVGTHGLSVRCRTILTMFPFDEDGRSDRASLQGDVGDNRASLHIITRFIRCVLGKSYAPAGLRVA